MFLCYRESDDHHELEYVPKKKSYMTFVTFTTIGEYGQVPYPFYTTVLAMCSLAVTEMEEGEKQKSGSHTVAIKWCRPNSVHYGVVQLVSKSLVKSMADEGNVTVLWPCKGCESNVWMGTLELASSKSKLHNEQENKIALGSTSGHKIYMSTLNKKVSSP